MELLIVFDKYSSPVKGVEPQDLGENFYNVYIPVDLAVLNEKSTKVLTLVLFKVGSLQSLVLVGRARFELATNGLKGRKSVGSEFETLMPISLRRRYNKSTKVTTKVILCQKLPKLP